MLLDTLPSYIRRGGTAAKPRTTPFLPNELWIHILELASRPTILIGDDYCPPDDIERCAKTRVSHETAKLARQFFRKNRGRLRAVCRLWRQFSDAIKEEEWALDVCNVDDSMKRLEETARAKPQDQSPIPRLNVLFRSATPIKLDHLHPVSSFTLVVATKVKGNERPSLDSLSSIIPHPPSLRSLHLTLGDIRHLPDTLIDPLAHPAIHLLTLSLKTSMADVFTSDLTFPHLTTLCVHIADECLQNNAGKTSWTLPSLTNLSLEFTILIRGTPRATFISRLLADHSRQLRSLRLISPCNAGLDVGLDTTAKLFWSTCPRLEVLATDFSSFLFDQLGRPLQKDQMDALLQSAWSSNLSLRHLIQNGKTCPSKFLGGLKRAIAHCAKLDTVSLDHASGNLFGKPPGFWTYWKLPQEEIAAVRRLEKLCRSRGVRILDAEGSEMKDILKENRF